MAGRSRLLTAPWSFLSFATSSSSPYPGWDPPCGRSGTRLADPSCPLLGEQLPTLSTGNSCRHSVQETAANKQYRKQLPILSTGNSCQHSVQETAANTQYRKQLPTLSTGNSCQHSVQETAANTQYKKQLPTLNTGNSCHTLYRKQLPTISTGNSCQQKVQETAATIQDRKQLPTLSKNIFQYLVQKTCVNTVFRAGNSCRDSVQDTAANIQYRKQLPILSTGASCCSCQQTRSRKQLQKLSIGNSSHQNLTQVQYCRPYKKLLSPFCTGNSRKRNFSSTNSFKHSARGRGNCYMLTQENLYSHSENVSSYSVHSKYWSAFTNAWSQTRDRTITLNFLGIILRVLRLEVSVWIS